MLSNSSSTSLVIGVTAFGLGLVVAGVRRYRRHRAEAAAARPENEEDEMEVKAVSGDEAHISGEDLPDEPEAPNNMGSNASPENMLLSFFLLVLVLSVPIWVIGGRKLPIPVDLPVSALMSFNPMIAAAILLYRRNGLNGIKALFKKAFDYKKIRDGRWYAPILLLMPFIYALSYAMMRLIGLPLPDSITVPLLMAPLFFLMYFIGAIGEELGWMGYAIDPMQNRWGALRASIILGFVWGMWHTIPFVQTGNGANWIVWQGLGLVARRILMVWIYNNTGKSVFAAILVHAMDNVSWSLFPNYGSHYDPFVTSIITYLTAVIVIIGWGPRTLSRYGRHRASRMA